MDPLTCRADDFLLEISPRCSVINWDFTVETVNYINLCFLQIQLNISLQNFRHQQDFANFNLCDFWIRDMQEYIFMFNIALKNYDD